MDQLNHGFTFITTFITEVKYVDRRDEEKEGELYKNFEAQEGIRYY